MLRTSTSGIRSLPHARHSAEALSTKHVCEHRAEMLRERVQVPRVERAEGRGRSRAACGADSARDDELEHQQLARRRGRELRGKVRLVHLADRAGGDADHAGLSEGNLNRLLRRQARRARAKLEREARLGLALHPLRLKGQRVDVCRRLERRQPGVGRPRRRGGAFMRGVPMVCQCAAVLVVCGQRRRARAAAARVRVLRGGAARLELRERHARLRPSAVVRGAAAVAARIAQAAADATRPVAPLRVHLLSGGEVGVLRRGGLVDGLRAEGRAAVRALWLRAGAARGSGRQSAGEGRRAEEDKAYRLRE